MARHTRLETLSAMKTIGLVLVFYNPDFEVAKNIASACVDGGANVVEFTNRADGPFERLLDTFEDALRRF